MQEFIAMGGYGAYVWSAFGIVAISMIVLALVAWRADRKALERIHRREENKQ